MFRFGDPGGRMYGSVGTSNANAMAHWTGYQTQNSPSYSVQAGGGRSVGSCLRFGINNFGVYFYKTFPDSQVTWGVAFAYRFYSWPSNAIVLADWRDSGTSQCDVRMNADGSFSVTRNGTALGATAPGLATLNSWVHVEFKATIHPSAGSAYVGVGGVQKLSLSGVNTRNSTNSSANQLYFGVVNNPSWGSYTIDFDDVIAYDGQPSDANGNPDITGPIGDCGLIWLAPSGAGTTTQFTSSTGANYAAVDDTTPNGDTDYVESSTVGNVDTYALSDLPAGATAVKSVAAVHYARKTDAGSRGMKSRLRSGGGGTSHAAEISLGDSYQYYFQNWGRDPNNGVPQDWTVAAVNALELGQIVSS